jgi:hypothetical protein
MIKTGTRRWGTEVVLTQTGGKINVYKVFVWKLEGKWRLGRHKHRWENIQTDLKETGWVYLGFIWLRIERNQAVQRSLHV